jgi:hypothetical protein
LRATRQHFENQNEISLACECNSKKQKKTFNMNDLPIVFSESFGAVHHCGEEERFRRRRDQVNRGAELSLLELCARACIHRLLDWEHKSSFNLVKLNDEGKAHLYQDMAAIMNDALCARAPVNSVRARSALLQAYVALANDFAMVNSVPRCVTAEHMDLVRFAKQRHANGKICSVIRDGQCHSIGVLDLSSTQVTDATLRLIAASDVAVDTLKLNRCRRVSGHGLLDFLQSYSAPPQRGIGAMNMRALVSFLDETDGGDELPAHLLGNLARRARHLRKLSVRQNKQFTLRTLCAIAPLARQLDLRHLDIRGCVFTPAFQRRLQLQFESLLCTLRSQY